MNAETAWPRCVPFGIYVAFLALPSLSDMPAGFDPRWLYGIQVFLVASALLALRSSYVELDDWRGVRAGEWMAALLVGFAIFVLWILPFPSWLLLGEPGAGFNPTRAGDGGVDWMLVGMRIAGAAIVVPVMEELFWRSFIMRWIQNARFASVSAASVGLRALLISSLLFGLEHVQWAAGAVAGIAYGWLYVRTGRLWPAVVAHAITNALLGAWVVATGNWSYW